MANPQQPNIANLNAAINGMATDGNTITQGLQSFTNHQQALGTELSLFGNTPLGQIHQQLATIQATILTMQTTILQLIDLSAARDWNMNAKFENAKVYQVTGGLVAMRSVDRAPNAQVLINHPIANFPPTADGVSQLTAIECRNILTALDRPIPAAPNVTAKHLRTAVRQAIGLAAL